jgi:hypothetical protein
MRAILFSATLVICSTTFSYAQCSDAGACAIGHRLQSPQHQIGVTYLFGKSGKTDDLTFHTIRAEGDFSLFERSRLSVEVPFSFQSGPLGNTNGIGDPIVIWNQTLYREQTSLFTVHLGAKFSIGNANSGNLPQAYQSTLGTNDFLIGATYEYEAWNASVVYQISRGRSINNTTRLKRGDDLLVRAGHRLNIQQATVVAELLAIKRLEESSVRNLAPLRVDDFIAVPGSDQFQINLQARCIYPLSERYNLQALVALPLLKRDVNVDGLTRSFSLSLGVSHPF